MKKIKSFFLFFLKQEIIAGFIVHIFLRLHNFSYRWVGVFASFLEPDNLHPKHRLMNYHQWFVDRIDPDWTVLDAGCGNGALAFDLKKKCRKVIAIDINSKNITTAKDNYAAEGIEYILGDILTYEGREHIHAVVLSNIVEHISERINFLKKMSLISSLLLIRVPAFDRDWITLYKKDRQIEWRLDSTHEIEYTMDSLQKELLACNLKILESSIRFGEIYVVAER